MFRDVSPTNESPTIVTYFGEYLRYAWPTGQVTVESTFAG